VSAFALSRLATAGRARTPTIAMRDPGGGTPPHPPHGGGGTPPLRYHPQFTAGRCSTPDVSITGPGAP
jgi:hypothetical protein